MSDDMVILDVGGRHFRTTRSTLRCGGGFLAALVKGDIPVGLTPEGAIFIDRDPKHFASVLNYCRSGLLPDVLIAPSAMSRSHLQELRSEALFYDLPELARACTPLGIAWCNGLLSPDRTYAWTSRINHYQYHSSLHAIISVPDVFNYRFCIFPADVEERRQQWQRVLAQHRSVANQESVAPLDLFPASAWKLYGRAFTSWIQSPLYVGLTDEATASSNGDLSPPCAGRRAPARQRLRVNHPPSFPTFGHRDLQASIGFLRLFAEEPADATKDLEIQEVQATNLEDLLPAHGAVVHAWPLRWALYTHLLPEGFCAEACFHTHDDNELVQDVELRISPGTAEEKRVLWWGVPPPWSHSCRTLPRPRASNQIAVLATPPETSQLHYFMQGRQEDFITVLSAVMEIVVQRRGSVMRVSALGPDFCQLWSYTLPCGDNPGLPAVLVDAFDQMTEIPLRVSLGGSRCPNL
jgi:hypothetical protein